MCCCPVRVGLFTDPLRAVPVFDALHPRGQVVRGEASACFGAGEPATRAVRGRAQPGGISLAAHMYDHVPIEPGMTARTPSWAVAVDLLFARICLPCLHHSPDTAAFVGAVPQRSSRSRRPAKRLIGNIIHERTRSIKRPRPPASSLVRLAEPPLVAHP